MSQWEHEQRCRLEDVYQGALAEFERALQFGKGDIEASKERLDSAQSALDEWDEHVVQVIPAPIGMVAVFERRDGREEVIPVSYIGLQRSGRVTPYMFMGNCQPRIPTQFSSFLRIDFKNLMGSGEVAFSEVGREVTEPISEEEVSWHEQQ